MADFRDELLSFCESVAERARERWFNASLARDWKYINRNHRHLVVLALLYPATISDVYWSFLNFKLHPIDYKSFKSIGQHRKECEKRLDEFFEESQVRRTLLQRKLLAHDFDSEHDRYLDANGGEPRFCQCECC